MATDSSSFFPVSAPWHYFGHLKKWRGRRRWSCAKVENGSSIRQWIFMIDIGLKRWECELYKAGWLNQAEQNKTGPFWTAVHEMVVAHIHAPGYCWAGRLTDWLAGQSCQGFRLSSLHNSLGFSFLTLVTRWPADAVTYGRSCRCCCCCPAFDLIQRREEKKRVSLLFSLSLSPYIGYPTLTHSSHYPISWLERMASFKQQH